MTQRQRQALNRPALAIFNNWNSITPDQKSSFAQLSFGELWASLVKYLKKMMTLSYFFAAAAFVVTCNLSWRLWKENNNVHAPTHTCTHIQHKQPHTRSHTTTHTHTCSQTHARTGQIFDWRILQFTVGFVSVLVLARPKRWSYFWLVEKKIAPTIFALCHKTYKSASGSYIHGQNRHSKCLKNL